MRRETFLARAGLLIGALALGKLPAPAPEEAEALAVVRDAVLIPTNDYAIFASGGLCAPIEPFYEVEVVNVTNPLRETSFTAPRTFPEEWT